MVRMRESILPDDVIKEILSRIPAKSVLHFRTVCKAWKSLISDPFFINLHLTRSLQRGPMHIILVHDMAPLSVFLVDAENPSNMSVCHSEKAAFNYAIGSCHGLVCTSISPHRNRIYLWNASTRKEMSFPYHVKFRNFYQEMSYGFFYDPTCCAYKFLTVKKRKGSRFSSKVRLYSGDVGEGKLIGDIPYQILLRRPGVAANNGAVHWLAFRCIPGERVSKEHVIVAFNPACEKFEEVPMPDNNRDDTLRDANLALLCGSLSITFTYINNFEVWLMKESWTKYFVVPTERRIFSAFKFPLRVVPLHITNKGDLILQTNYGKVFTYDQKQKTLTSIEIKCPEPGPYLLGNLADESFRAITLVDSLVDIGNNYGRKNTKKPESSLQGLSRTLTHKSRQCSSTISEASPGNSLVENKRAILPESTVSSNHKSLVQPMHKCLENPPVDSFYELNSSKDPIFVPSEEIQVPGIPASLYLKSTAVSVQLRSMANDNMYQPFENHQLPWFSDGIYTRTTQPHSMQQHYNFQEQDRHQYETKHYQNHIPSQMGIGYPNPRLFPVGFFQDPIVQSLIVEAIASIELPIPPVSVQQYGSQGYQNCNPFQDPRNQILIREALANIQVPMPTHSEQLQYNFHKLSPQ